MIFLMHSTYIPQNSCNKIKTAIMRVCGLFFLCFYIVLVGAVLARNLNDEEKFIFGSGGNWFGRPIFGPGGWFPGFGGQGGGLFPGIGLAPPAGAMSPDGSLAPPAGSTFPVGGLAPPPPGRFDQGRWFYDHGHDGPGGGGGFMPGAHY